MVTGAAAGINDCIATRSYTIVAGIASLAQSLGHPPFCDYRVSPSSIFNLQF